MNRNAFFTRIHEGGLSCCANKLSSRQGNWEKVCTFAVDNVNTNSKKLYCIMTKKWVCPVCGYVYEGENPPEKCPQCKVPGSKFLIKEASEGLCFACEHELGVAKAIPEGEEGAFVLQGLKNDFMGECTEVGMYLAMSRQADREGYPEVAEAFKRYAFEEAEHAAKFAELLGEVVWDTKTNVKARMEAEEGACAGKLKVAKIAKQLGLDAIHDTVHEMAKDEARHGAGFQGLWNRYFKDK